MLQTLFYIPNHVAGIPVFGFGWLFYAFVAASTALMAWLVYRQGFSRDTWSYLPLLVVFGAVIVFVLPRIAQPEGLPVRGYGVMLLLAIVLAVGTAAWRAKRLGVDPELIVSLAFWGIVPGLIGARLFYVIEYWPAFHHASRRETLIDILNVTQGGLVVYGSFVGGIAGLAGCILWYKLPALATLDLLMPSVMLGSAVGRIGCFLNGCCYGGVCVLPWAVSFPPGSPPYIEQVERGEIFVEGLKILGRPYAPPVISGVQDGSAASRHGLRPGQRITEINGQPLRNIEQARFLLMKLDRPGASISITTADGQVHAWNASDATHRSLPVHPTQLYSTINDGLLCLLLLAYAPFRRRDGEILALAITLYPATRFLMEIIRTDEAGVFGTGMTISQNLSLLFLVVAAGLWFHVLHRPRGTVFPKYGEAASRRHGDD